MGGNFQKKQLCGNFKRDSWEETFIQKGFSETFKINNKIEFSDELAGWKLEVFSQQGETFRRDCWKETLLSSEV